MSTVLKTMDGNTAAAHVAYAFTEIAGIYPITPSTPMAESVDEWSAHGLKNMFGQTVRVIEMQSEAGAAGTVHGALQGGALTTTFTASQGLLLMIPNMYKIAGELLPGVFHVSARALASHALSIFGDHSDVMAARQTGFALLASAGVQEVMDLAGVAHLSAIRARVPFLHFFDGFRTSNEIQKIEVISHETLKNLTDMKKVEAFRKRALNPEHPVLRGTAQNPDIFFQAREASNLYYQAVPGVVEHYMEEIRKVTGRAYHLFDYVGAPDAKHVVVAMGSVCETIEETLDYLLAKGEKAGLLKVRLYRPFSLPHFLKAMPSTVERISVLDRTKEAGSIGEPLYLDVRSAYYDQKKQPLIVGGRYGLGSKDTTPSQIMAVYRNLKDDSPKNGFTIGIVDDVTGFSLKTDRNLDTSPPGTISCKFWGLGSDGTVGANKNAIKIIGDHTELYAQAYFSYDSKKSGGVTISHLRFGKKPIKSTYLVSRADFVACHNQAYLYVYDMVSDLKPGGTFLLNTHWTEEELETHLPASVKRYIAKNQIRFCTLDGVGVATSLGLGARINMVMMAGFFKLAGIIPAGDAVRYMKEAILQTYGNKGQKVIDMNNAAVDQGMEKLKTIQVPEHWSRAKEKKELKSKLPPFIREVADVMNAQQGDTLPVSAFAGIEDGTFPMATSQYEKRAIAITVPEWQADRCIQCNQCSYVCPHAVIRPFLLNEEEVSKAPASFVSKKAVGKGAEGLNFRIQVSVYDCTGCENCAQVCPAKEKALLMKPIESQCMEAKHWEYAMGLSPKVNPMSKYTVKGSQFEQPLIEFSGACAGCGETPYIKLITQLYGDRMMIANSTGCSSIWGGSAPSVPYAVNRKGQGPAWANSLFEDTAEYGFGMHVAVEQIRDRIEELCRRLMQLEICGELKDAAAFWVENRFNGDQTREAKDRLMKALRDCSLDCCNEEETKQIAQELLEKGDFMIKRSQWIVGGDGWAYDIGYGGLDHVLALREDVNILVFDTEVYSNTGGQASKSTPTGSVAKFAAAGKPVKKKDLGLMAISYGYVYVAQVAMGASQSQFIKALQEAESYPGPSLIIAYSPCISHGLKLGMEYSQQQTKNAVEAGYWHLYRYNPLLKEQGKNPFILDSKEPSTDYIEFLKSETRYTSLSIAFPEMAGPLFEKAAKEARDRYETYRKMAESK